MKPTDGLRIGRVRAECDGTPFDSSYTYTSFLEMEYLEKLSEVSDPKNESQRVRRAN